MRRSGFRGCWPGRRCAAAQRNALRQCNAALIYAMLVLVFFNPLHPAHFLKPDYHDIADARRALACVPAGAWVATHDEWFSVIAARSPRATLGTISGVDDLVYADDYPNVEFQTTVRHALAAEVAAGTYRKYARFGAVATYAQTGKRAPR